MKSINISKLPKITKLPNISKVPKISKLPNIVVMHWDFALLVVSLHIYINLVHSKIIFMINTSSTSLNNIFVT